MGRILILGLPEAEPAAEPWPVDEHTIRVDEMFARQLDNEFAGHVRGLLHDPETGITAQGGEATLHAIAGAMPALVELKDRTLSQAIGPRQRSILEPLIDTRLDWAAGTLGRLAQRATVEVDDQSVAERIAGLNQDAATAWQDPAYLRKLGRTAVEELRYQGERRGWDPTETDARVRGGLSDLYGGAVETAILQDDLDGAATLYDHAREVIAPERQAAIDRRFVQAREAAVYRDVDRDMAGIPIDPAGPPGGELFEERAAELTPEDASDEMRARIGQVAAFAHRRAERQWQKQQAIAGVAALDWLNRNPEAPLAMLPFEVRDWLAPDQREGLNRAAVSGRVETDPEIHDRLDRQAVYEPQAFAGIDLDRHRLQLDDRDFGRLAAIQQAEAESRADPAQARWSHTLIGLDRALQARDIDLESPAAREARARARDSLDSFEVIEDRPPLGADLDEIVQRAVEPFWPDPESFGGDGIDPAIDDDASVTPGVGPAERPAPDAEPTYDGPTHDGPIPPFANDPNIIRVQGGIGGGSGRGAPPPRAPSTPAQRPTPGLGHNQPPAPGLPTLIDKMGWGRRPPPSPQPPGVQPTPDPAGPATSAEQLGNWLAERNRRTDRDEYTGADGIDTAAGVRLDPRVGEPAAGRDYQPDNESHRKGLRGEYGLANDIARHFPDHTVIEFGRKAGERGPDVISVDRNGEVHLWDSKWRGADTSIGPGSRAHQTDNSLKEARVHANRSIDAAVKSGRLSPEAGTKAVQNVESRNLTIVTVGTGSARNGVVERIVGGERAVVHPEGRP